MMISNIFALCNTENCRCGVCFENFPHLSVEDPFEINVVRGKKELTLQIRFTAIKYRFFRWLQTKNSRALQSTTYGTIKTSNHCQMSMPLYRTLKRNPPLKQIYTLFYNSEFCYKI